MPLTGLDKGLLGVNLAQGLFSGLSGANQQKQSQQQSAQNRLDAILNQLMQFQQGKLDRQRQDAQNFASAQGPLGQEQQFVQRNNIMRAILPQMAQAQASRPTDPAIAQAMGQVQNPLSGLMQGGQVRPDVMNTFSDTATASSLAEQRKALASLRQDHQFGSLNDFGLGPDANIFDSAVGQAGKLVSDQRTAGYYEIQRILDS